jgi:peroxiredoxin Q/BCP
MPAKLVPGDKAPDFELPSDDGGKVSLADFKGRKLVIYFYPRADTPGCTKESIDFSKHKSAFSRANTAVLGVSADPVRAQAKFRDKHGLKIPLGSDETAKMLKAYGAWGEKSLYGRKFLGVIRSTVLVGEDGTVAQLWPKVKVEGHAEEVLAAAKAL